MTQNDKEKCGKINFYKFFNPESMFNINFKNCLIVVGRYVENLFLDSYEEIKNWTIKVIQRIIRVRQKIRPGRSFPRKSLKPVRRWIKKEVIPSVIY